MSYTLLYAETLPPSSLAPLVENGVEAHCIHVVSDLVPNEQPTVFVLDAASRTAFPVAALRAFVDAGGAVVAVGRPGESDVPDGFPLDLLSGFVPSPTGLARLLETLSALLRRGPRRPSSGRQLLVAVHAGYREAAARAATARARKEAMLRASEVRELTTISAKLMTERDPAKLVDDILTQARQFSQSDAGSLYLVEKDEETGIKRLRFKWAQNFSKPDIPFKESTIPIDSSNLAGYTASTGEPLVIDDVYALPPDAGFTFDRSFDERFGYRTQSMLLLPMRDHKDRIIGVLQLINRKRTPDARLDTPTDVEREVVPFSRRTVELVGALAGQAAVSIENSQLYDRINRMFREFVDASVQAIEQRDPITKGHSKRVAGRTVGLAEAVDRAGLTRFSRDQIREIEYAGLLHDFGKVGVKEDVLQKAKKLYPDR
ncbi:MAG: HD-GYP domain-containing protein, partial [Acidobacteriota bacterium]